MLHEVTDRLFCEQFFARIDVSELIQQLHEDTGGRKNDSDQRKRNKHTCKHYQGYKCCMLVILRHDKDRERLHTKKGWKDSCSGHKQQGSIASDSTEYRLISPRQKNSRRMKVHVE